MNVLEEKINGVQLTKTQKKIADYFLKNQERIGNLASLEVAKEIGVSDASIIRFSRTIGYDGYADLKKDIYNNLAFKATENIGRLNLTERFDVANRKFSQENLKDSFVELMGYNVRKSLLSNKQEDYEAAVNLIHTAQKRVVIGFHGCKGIALQFSRLLGIIESNVSLLTSSEPDCYSQLQDVQEQDIVVLFSFARYYQADEDFIQYARNRKASIILITDSVISPYMKYADVAFIAATDHMSFFNSIVGAGCISEYLLTLLTRVSGKLERFDERDALTEKLRIQD